MHSYFGQVRVSSTSDIQLDAAPLSTMEHASTDGGDEKDVVGRSPSGGIDAPGMEKDSGIPCSFHALDPQQAEEAVPATSPSFHPYPTPPTSSPSSVHKEQQEASAANSAPSRTRGSSATVELGFGQASRTKPLAARRHTSAIFGHLSTVLANPSVHAHISNPCSFGGSETESKSPTFANHSASDHVSILSSYNEHKKLTEGAMETSREKSTPPETPRSLSTTTPQLEKSTLRPALNPVLPGISQVTASGSGTPRRSTPDTGPSNSAAAAVGPPKGKLSVLISEGRGLRPSHDPYVVCVFEYNEYISKGPRKRTPSDDQREFSQDDAGGVALKNAGSDMGRAIAIPMKSRQSSNTSLSDYKDIRDSRAITDPKWGHEATL
jgi:hypothetical protein